METKVSLTKEMIDQVFETSDDADTCVVELYKIAIPEWDNVISIQGYPIVNQKTNLYIFEKAIAFDRIHNPNIMAGGTWMNSGFSTLESQNLEDWWIDNHNVVLKMKLQETHKQKMDRLINLLEVNGHIQELETLYIQYCKEYELWEENLIHLVIPFPASRLSEDIYKYISSFYLYTDRDICYEIANELVCGIFSNIKSE